MRKKQSQIAFQAGGRKRRGFHIVASEGAAEVIASASALVGAGMYFLTGIESRVYQNFDSLARFDEMEACAKNAHKIFNAADTGKISAKEAHTELKHLIRK